MTVTERIRNRDIANLHEVEGIVNRTLVTFQIPEADFPLYQRACEIDEVKLTELTRKKGDLFLTGRFGIEKIKPDGGEVENYDYVTKPTANEVLEGMVAISLEVDIPTRQNLGTTLQRLRIGIIK